MKYFVLYVFLLLVSVTAAQTLTQGVITLAGTVYAPDGEDIAGTVVVACFVQGSDCEESKTKKFEITESGASASFNIIGLARETYMLFASKDKNTNDAPFEDGDFYALYGTDGNVQPPARDLDLQLEILGSTQPATANEPTKNTSSSDGLEPYTVTGIVLDTKGQPLEGAIIRLRADFLTGWVEVTSDPDGRYKASSDVQTPYASYTIEAFKQTDYNGQTICTTLAMPDPNDYNSFTMDEGAEKNFQWQLTGKVGNYDTFFGGTIGLWNSYVFYDKAKAIEFTLTPTGPLLDGSEGSVIVREVALEAPSDDDALVDVPIGPYTLQAVLIGHDDSRTPIGLSNISATETSSSEVAIDWRASDWCGFGHDSGVDPITLLLDETQ
jgi:hypothetical protein